MSIRRSIRIATVAVAAGLSTGTATPALADGSTGDLTTISSGSGGTAKETWSECWRREYFAARDAGLNDGLATWSADQECGA